MKEIHVTLSGEHRAFVTELLDRVNATGYTIIGNVSGTGRPGRKIEAHLCGPLAALRHHSGVLFISDVAVSRQEYFGKQ